MTLEAIKEQENSGEIQKDTNTEDKNDVFNNMGGTLTGDTTNMMMYMGLGCMSLGMMLFILFKRKQEE